MKNLFFAIVAALLTIGCNTNNSTDNSVTFNAAVDLSDMLEIYEKNGKKCDVSFDNEVYHLLCPYEQNDTSTGIPIEIYDDEPFTYEFPEYRQSKHPFLSMGEDLFNCCIVTYAVWNNYEIWCRYYGLGDQSIPESIQKIDLECIRDKELHRAAMQYRDGMASMLSKADTVVYEDDSPIVDLKEAFMSTIYQKWYKYREDASSFDNIMCKTEDSLDNAVNEAYQGYLKSEENVRLGVMLNALNKCKTFDEQCALYRNWANTEWPFYEDLWIIAVGTRLMQDDHYTPILHFVWGIWRTLCQRKCCGPSHDSEIPNKFYNDYRARCYAVCLKYINTHQNDTLAINCASVLAGITNINRFGPAIFGNQSELDAMELLPNRYKALYNTMEESADSVDQ